MGRSNLIAERFAIIKTLAAKVIARTFWRINEMVNYIDDNYLDLCDDQSEKLNILIFNALFESYSEGRRYLFCA